MCSYCGDSGVYGSPAPAPAPGARKEGSWGPDRAPCGCVVIHSNEPGFAKIDMRTCKYSANDVVSIGNTPPVRTPSGAESSILSVIHPPAAVPQGRSTSTNGSDSDNGITSAVRTPTEIPGSIPGRSPIRYVAYWSDGEISLTPIEGWDEVVLILESDSASAVADAVSAEWEWIRETVRLMLEYPGVDSPTWNRALNAVLESVRLRSEALRARSRDGG